ncbi:MAG TPA: multicopper oxidase domain-containing protein [Candidatus Dormibacteraeota bacterium]|nr:multicopper oxidase domain-containing protein [Candidatus Dormibacteraeota bacterium]
MDLFAPRLKPFVDLLPVPPRHVVKEPIRLTIRLQTVNHRFHRDLPPSRVWAYDGHVPGPTIEVDRRTELEVRWENHLSGPLPVVVTRAPVHAAGGIPVQCVAGRSGGEADPLPAALSGYAVAHLHGALTQATSDGWTENLIGPGQSTVDTYQNDQRAALLWYHDHVMGITRFDLYAGLAGLWIVRDARERELKLPEGPPYELPLMLADRNFDTAADGSLTGRLLHKTDPEVMECFSPFTTVNGAIWPEVEVEPTTYRFRVLNGSNARTYRLVLTREGQPDHDRIRQIGSDGGLLVAPVLLPAEGLVLASAERADILIDFSDLSVGTELTLWNNAPSPFNGAFADPSTAGTADLEGLLPYPEVLRFRVIDGPRVAPMPRPVLATDFQRADASQLEGCPVRAIALVELESSREGEPSMLTMRELAEGDGTDESELTLVESGTGQTEQVKRWRTVATRFEDKTNFFPEMGRAEIWRLINLTGDTHPIHVHLDAFQIISRQPAVVELPEGGITDTGTRATVRIGQPAGDGIQHGLDANELGLKDTVRVNANEVIEILVCFRTFAGRYMYHCHILEHEDRDMMRPFVVMAAELMPFM